MHTSTRAPLRQPCLLRDASASGRRSERRESDQGQGCKGSLSCVTGVCKINIPFAQAYALQHSRKCYPPPNLVLFELTFRRVFFSGGMFFFHRRRYGWFHTSLQQHLRIKQTIIMIIIRLIMIIMIMMMIIILIMMLITILIIVSINTNMCIHRTNTRTNERL